MLAGQPYVGKGWEPQLLVVTGEVRTKRVSPLERKRRSPQLQAAVRWQRANGRALTEPPRL